MFFPLKIIKTVPKMSFPPGPPIPLPGMPPVPSMLPPPFAVPPMGMIPMTVGMMPASMMAPVAMTIPTPIPIPHHQRLPIKKNVHNIYRKFENQPEPPQLQESLKGPPVTVFVGNITERASDNLVRQMLQRCGIVLSWKRVQGANGKLQAFGFCEYGDPESALRAMRLLHDYGLGGKKLVVKVDAKTKEKLDEYKASKIKLHDDDTNTDEDKAKKQQEDNGKEDGETSDDALDEASKQRDIAIAANLQSLVNAYAYELNKPMDDGDSIQILNTSQPEKPVVENSPRPRIDFDRVRKNELDEMDLEDDKKSLIHREIDKFRDTYVRAEEEQRNKDKDRRPRRKESPESHSKDRERERRSSRERSAGREDRSRRRRSRERERKRESPRSSPVISKNHRDRSREVIIEKPASREKIEWNRENREKDDDKVKDRDYDTNNNDDDSYERKKQERKIREKEAIYQERLRNWNNRERRKGKEYEKEKCKKDAQKKEELREAKKLKEFLEDYDDERDDLKYFKGSALVRRMKEREKEIEEDMIDRQREKEEIEELRKKLVEEGHPDPEGEVERMMLEESRLLEPPPKPESLESDTEEFRSPNKGWCQSKPSSPPEEEEEEEYEHEPDRHDIIHEEDISQNSFSGFADVLQAPEEAKRMGFTSLRLGGSPTHQNNSPTISNSSNHVSNKRKVALDDIFNVNDEESESKKKRKLVPIDDQQDTEPKSPTSISQMTMEEKRKYIKNLIEKIPTERHELFAYSLDWTIVDKVLMEKRIRPWINKKIIEYIGEEEPTLVEFICSKIMAGSAAQSILDDVSMVLDEEAEVFVVKMWRLLIYEIEAKKLGLVCKSEPSQDNSTSGGKSER